MVQVRGTVHDVSDNPDRVEKIIVRAVEPRMHGTTYITEEPTQFPVVDGVLDFNVLPGPCVVAFLRNHGATTYEKLLVPDVDEATFRECLDAADLAEGATKATLENAVRQVQEELSKVAPLVNEVRTLHTEVSDDRTAVDGFAKAAQKSASDAATSQSKAKTSETNAANSAASAESQQKSAKTHFNNTVKEAEKAANSATAAKASETNAASSASASASSASSSKTQAGKSAASATQAAASRDAAKASETAAAGSAAAAKTSETNAAQSSSTANTHRAAAATQASAASESASQAATARDAAKQSQTAAKTSETNANKHRQAAATSESNAATHKTNAGESAAAAASSAAEAKGHADRAEVASDPEGLRNEMTKQFAALVDGAPEDLDTIREIAEYAQANRDVTDQLNAAIGNKANKTHTHAWTSITGRPDIPVTDTGYLTYDASDPATDYPPGVSYGLNNGTNQGWNDVIKADTGHDYFGSFVMVQTLREGRYIQTTTQLAFTYNNAHKPVFMRKWHGNEVGWGPFRSLTDDGHKHAISDVADLQTELDSKPTHSTMNSGLNGKANKSHTHAQSDITGLSTALSGKANSSHKHTTSDITDFSTEMGKKADKSHTHSQSDITGLSTALSGKANSSHTHTQGEVTGLTTALNGKAAKSHTHTQAQVTGLSTALNGKADKTYVNSRPALFSGVGAPPSSIAGAVAGDFWLNTTTMELHKITGV